jgi:hypothetical protein
MDEKTDNDKKDFDARTLEMAKETQLYLMST